LVFPFVAKAFFQAVVWSSLFFEAAAWSSYFLLLLLVVHLLGILCGQPAFAAPVWSSHFLHCCVVFPLLAAAVSPPFSSCLVVPIVAAYRWLSYLFQLLCYRPSPRSCCCRSSSCSYVLSFLFLLLFPGRPSFCSCCVGVPLLAAASWPSLFLQLLCGCPSSCSCFLTVPLFAAAVWSSLFLQLLCYRSSLRSCCVFAPLLAAAVWSSLFL
jgi:hypothetical protein